MTCPHGYFRYNFEIGQIMINYQFSCNLWYVSYYDARVSPPMNIDFTFTHLFLSVPFLREYTLYTFLLINLINLYATIHRTDLNTLRPRQNGRHFADDMFKCIFMNENVWIPIEISLKFVPKGSINNNPALFQIMVWRRPGDKPLSETMMVISLTHICVTRPQWVLINKYAEHLIHTNIHRFLSGDIFVIYPFMPYVVKSIYLTIRNDGFFELKNVAFISLRPSDAMCKDVNHQLVLSSVIGKAHI